MVASILVNNDVVINKPGKQNTEILRLTGCFPFIKIYWNIFVSSYCYFIISKAIAELCITSAKDFLFPQLHVWGFWI